MIIVNNCPICENEAELETDVYRGTYLYYIVCSNKDCRLQGPDKDCEEDAIEIWNGLSYNNSKSSPMKINHEYLYQVKKLHTGYVIKHKNESHAIINKKSLINFIKASSE